MNCSTCHGVTRVLESRRADDGASLRRRRACTRCGQRFTTYERREAPALYVRKRGGRREAFDRQKLRAGMLRAAYKRPVAARQVEAIVDRIEARGEAEGGELDAERIGDMCLEGLGEVDRVAYLQFASVYKQLADIDELRAELSWLAASTPATGSSTPGSVRSARKHLAAPVKAG